MYVCMYVYKYIYIHKHIYVYEYYTYVRIHAYYVYTRYYRKPASMGEEREIRKDGSGLDLGKCWSLVIFNLYLLQYLCECV